MPIKWSLKLSGELSTYESKAKELGAAKARGVLTICKSLQRGSTDRYRNESERRGERLTYGTELFAFT